MAQKKDEKQISNKAEQAIQESNSSLLDIVQAVPTKSQHKHAKSQPVYPANQITPALDTFESHLAKQRETE
ncbi:MAG: hypothetical protein Q4B28_03355 [bacterium]|nr:hypothetical protein [bacterium]